MPIGHEKETIDLFLQGDPVVQHAMVVPQVQSPGWAHARQYSGLIFLTFHKAAALYCST
jgi:hypothetical protein